VYQEKDVVKAPVAALFRDGDGWAVFAVQDARARKRAVKAPRRNGVEALIEEGLRPGELVVVYPSDALRDGARLEAVRKGQR
jgi:HlyD family secretion protein